MSPLLFISFCTSNQRNRSKNKSWTENEQSHYSGDSRGWKITTRVRARSQRAEKKTWRMQNSPTVWPDFKSDSGLFPLCFREKWNSHNSSFGIPTYLYRLKACEGWNEWVNAMRQHEEAMRDLQSTTIINNQGQLPHGDITKISVNACISFLRASAYNTHSMMAAAAAAVEKEGDGLGEIVTESHNFSMFTAARCAAMRDREIGWGKRREIK